MVVLFAPLIQQNFKPFRFAPLIGYETPTPQPAFSWKDYQSGTYQIQLEKFLSENIGFRQPIIRLYNQYVYDFYKKTYCHEVSIEKDGWLYHAEGVMEYFGNMEQKFGFTNDEVRENLADEARCLAKIQAILEEYGVHLVVFTLPTKSYIYPEHLRRHPVGDTTFNAIEYYEQVLQEHHIANINMTSWFKQMQDTSRIDLFYSKGSHWAAGTPLAVDSLLRCMEQVGSQNLTRLELGEPYANTDIPLDDKDLENLLNLPRPLPHEPIYEYPVTLLTSDSTCYPTVWFVGTSFYWYMKRRVDFDILFQSRDFTFYQTTYYTNKEKTAIPMDEVDYLRELLIHDYVVYFRNGPQLHANGFMFPGRSLISLCISDQRLEEKTREVANELMKNRNDNSFNDTIKCLMRARYLLETDPERWFEELSGDSVPSCRNPKIALMLAERDIRADRDWNIVLNAKARYDSIPIKHLFAQESFNYYHKMPLLRDNAFFTSYDWFDNYMEEAILNVKRRNYAIKDEAQITSLAYEELETRIRQHEFDCDTLLMTACAMDEIINNMNNPSSMASIREKAKERNVSIDMMFYGDALWCLKQRGIQPSLNDTLVLKAFELYKIERAFRTSTKSMNNINQKRKEQDLPLLIALRKDVDWVYNNQKHADSDTEPHEQH